MNCTISYAFVNSFTDSFIYYFTYSNVNKVIYYLIIEFKIKTLFFGVCGSVVLHRWGLYFRNMSSCYVFYLVFSLYLATSSTTTAAGSGVLSSNGAGSLALSCCRLCPEQSLPARKMIHVLTFNRAAVYGICVDLFPMDLNSVKGWHRAETSVPVLNFVFWVPMEEKWSSWSYSLRLFYTLKCFSLTNFVL